MDEKDDGNNNTKGWGLSRKAPLVVAEGLFRCCFTVNLCVAEGLETDFVTRTVLGGTSIIVATPHIIQIMMM
jgi:hypothetical protein